MSFWLAVLVGGLFVWIAVQIGFYATWMLWFNVVLSVYMGIFLTPLVIYQIPEAAATPYGCALTMVSIAVATLLIAYGICIALLSGRLRFAFPKMVDNVAAGLLGFLTGFLVWSFLAFALCLTPVAQARFADTFGFRARSQRVQTFYLCWWCDRLHWLVSASDAPTSSRQVVDSLLRQTGMAPAEQPDGDAAQTPAELNHRDEGTEEQTPPASKPAADRVSSPPKQDRK